MSVILVTNTYKDDVLEIVKSCVPEGFEIRTLYENTEDALLSCVEDAEYILASGRVKIGRAVLEKAGKLKMVQRTGVGLDSLDLGALRQMGIPLYVNKGVNSQSVAEHALLLMMACLRKLPEINTNTKQGIWDKQKQGIKTRELFGKTVGIIGMGSIGRALVALLRPFQVRVLYVDLFPLPENTEKELGVTRVGYEELYEKSDIISLHCPLLDTNRHFVCRETINQMKDGVILVNTARGGLVCGEDLADAIREGKVAAAGIDVYDQEPVKEDNPLLNLPQVITTPHIGGVTYDSFFQMMHHAMKNIELFEKGQLEKIASSRCTLP